LPVAKNVEYCGTGILPVAKMLSYCGTGILPVAKNVELLWNRHLCLPAKNLVDKRNNSNKSYPK
jgi:hypothetical protein